MLDINKARKGNTITVKQEENGMNSIISLNLCIIHTL